MTDISFGAAAGLGRLRGPSVSCWVIDDSVDSGRRTVEIRNEVIEWPAHCYAQMCLMSISLLQLPRRRQAHFNVVHFPCCCRSTGAEDA